MTTQIEYRELAEDCVRLSLTASTGQERSDLLLMAGAWLQLSDEAACQTKFMLEDRARLTA